ncbi:MAG: DUF4330 domain-containing protein [Firmicutes bacterium]|nr:DUF4330 domain-containing protein [Candidatus Fermentithermobacillaceae bacterium]
MKVLDEKGRLFGKISIIDLLVIVVIVGAVAWFGYSMFGKNLRTEVSQREEETEIVVVASGMRPTTAEAIAKGGKIFEFKTGACVGEVVGVETEPAVVWLLEGDGRWVQTQSDDKVDAFVTIRGTARVGENVITMNGVEIRVGGSIGLKTKFATFQGYIMNMDLDLGGTP